MTSPLCSKVSIIQTTDALKKEFHVSLKATTLANFKEMIISSLSIDEGIRVFHLGRELKSGGRSLETLGIGRFRNFTIHVHPSAKKTTQVRTQQQRNSTTVAASPKHQAVVNLLHDSDDEVSVVQQQHAPSARPSKRRRKV